MLKNFFYGQCSLHEAFWKFSFLGLAVSGFLARLLMQLLKQSVNYDPDFMRIFFRGITIFGLPTTSLAFLAFYIAAFLALIAYAIVCVVGMYNTYKEYEKSKILAFICLGLTVLMAYFAIKYAIY